MLLAACGALVGLFVWSFVPPHQEGPLEEFVVAPSEQPVELRERLVRAGLVTEPILFRAYVAFFAAFVEFPPRSHLLGPGLSPRELVARLSGRPAKSTTKVLLPEGVHRFEVARRLERASVCAGRAFLAEVEEPSLLAELGIEHGSLEGYLFPSTYEFRHDEDPSRVARRLFGEAKRRHAAILAQVGGLPPEARELGLGWNDIVTLGSIVEKETGRPEERGLIARVFYNRLLDPKGETGGRLESDPTAFFGCLEAGHRLPGCDREATRATPSMIHDVENPYGTYRRAGLPKGPIGSPGEAALRAVLTPEASDALYFVADGEGGHTFSRTFEEHKKAVNALRNRRSSPDSTGAKIPD